MQPQGEDHSYVLNKYVSQRVSDVPQLVFRHLADEGAEGVGKWTEAEVNSDCEIKQKGKQLDSTKLLKIPEHLTLTFGPVILKHILKDMP